MLVPRLPSSIEGSNNLECHIGVKGNIRTDSTTIPEGLHWYSKRYFRGGGFYHKQKRLPALAEIRLPVADKQVVKRSLCN